MANHINTFVNHNKFWSKLLCRLSDFCCDLLGWR